MALQAVDIPRLDRQRDIILALMKDGHERTLSDIEKATGEPQASISARLRDFRKAKFGAWVVQRRRLKADGGTYAYRVLPGHSEGNVVFVTEDDGQMRFA